MLLNILYWVILILSALGIIFVPPAWPNSRFISGGAWLALFVIIGLRVFKTAIE